VGSAAFKCDSDTWAVGTHRAYSMVICVGIYAFAYTNELGYNVMKGTEYVLSL
jgi:hypothetical protein